MKQKLIHCCAGVLLSVLCVTFVACNDEDMKINPVPVSKIDDEIAAFFEEYLAFSIDKPNPGFYFGDVDPHEQICLTVNSVEEFKAVVPYAAELPAIDFDKFTLVFVQYYSTGGTYPKSHSFNVEPDVMIFNLVLGDTGKGLAAMFRRRFWSLYPKIPQKAITFNVVTIKEYES